MVVTQNTARDESAREADAAVRQLYARHAVALRGYVARSGWAAFLIGAASAPQAAASGYRAAYTIPDVATAALGVLVAAGVLTTAGRAGPPGPSETTNRISS